MNLLGQVFKETTILWAIIEIDDRVVVTCECLKEEADFKVNMSNKKHWSLDQISERNIEFIGTLSQSELERAKRERIFDRVREFHDLFHKKSDAFDPGKTGLHYAGKVYDDEEMVALTDASLDFWLTSGRFVERFQRELSHYLGVRYVMVTNSGSSANLLAISALTSSKLGEKRLKPGDEVITVGAGFPTTVAPIVQNGLIPVFVDVDLGTYNVSIDQLEQAISSKTKAIILAHTMGNPFDLDKVMRVATKYGLWVIEDNCDSLGSQYKGKFTGTFGHIGTSSFYPPHHITMGEGGAVYTNDPQLKVIIESFRDWGRDCWCDSGCDNTCGKRHGWQLGELPFGYDHKYTYSHLGYNLKATDMQAAIGLKQLEKLPHFIERRIHNFERLKAGLKHLKEELILPEATLDSVPSWFGFVLTVRDGHQLSRTKVTQFLEDNKIQTRMLFAGNITRQPAFKNVDFRISGALKNTDKIMNDTFLVGVYPGLNDDRIDYMIDRITAGVINSKR